ncbi:MAG TPA: sulfite exporter TauE/SafE family protein [Rhodocyclaceae bacterium]|nr:sulfite exporter TauE/SafE family protein [Rhodocyclaceae bacterium]
MTIPVETVALAGFIITLAYTIFGLTGFGSSITAVPLLAQIFPLRFVVPMMVLFDLCAGLLFGARNHRAISRPELLRILPFMLIGIALGGYVLVYAPEGLLLLSLGTFVLVYAGWSLLMRPNAEPVRARWSAPCGIVGGMFSAVFGTGGPVYTMYLARRLPEKDTLRATIASVIMLSGVSRFALFSSTGLYGGDALLLVAALLAPCAMVGLFVGSRLHRRLPTHRVVQAVWVVLIIGGISLIVRALATA